MKFLVHSWSAGAPSVCSGNQQTPGLFGICLQPITAGEGSPMLR